MKSPLNAKAIAEGVKLQNDHKVHITGDGYLSLIKQVQGFESSTDFNVRTQISKPATIQITSIILDNLNRWTSSQGTVKRCDFKDTEKNKAFEEVLDQVWHGQSFDDFIKTFYKEAIYTEFNGFALVTKPKVIEGGFIEKEGVISKAPEGNLNPYIIFISASDIHDFKLTGNKCEYVVIRLSKDTYRIIDDQKDIVISWDEKTFNVESFLSNEIGYVPAIKISNINKSLLSDQVKTSPIDHVIPALQRYFSSDADLRMQFIKHNYPKLAIVTRECTHCGGQGFTYDDNRSHTDDLQSATKIKCNTCDGTGKEIPISRDGVIGLPGSISKEDQAYPGAPATYISPDVESLKLGIEDLKAQREDIIYSATGDKNLISESLNTATENNINNRALEDRIAEIIAMVEQFETFLKKAIKDLHKSFTNIGAENYSITVKYGKRISTRGESDLTKEIKDSKDAGLPFSYIQGLHKDLIYTKYKNNQDEYDRYLILSDIEPMSAYSIEEIIKLSNYIEKKDIQLKANFDNLIDEFEMEYGKVQYYSTDKSYEERVSLIKAELYESIQERFGASSDGDGQDVGVDQDEQSDIQGMERVDGDSKGARTISGNGNSGDEVQ